MIKGIYKLPAIKHAFFIMSSLEDFGGNSAESPDSKKRMEYFEHILQLRDHICPKEIPLWTLEVVSESEFLKVLEQRMPKGKVSSNLSSHNPECLELLAINLIKTPEQSSDLALKTPTVLGVIPDEDIIEVFI